jgi:hypothetical protein
MSANDEQGTPLLVGEQVQAYAFLMYAEGVQAAITAIEEHPHPGDDPVRFYRELLGELRPDSAKCSAAEAETTPDFFQPGRTYVARHDGYTAPELIVRFRVEHVTRHPDRGHLRAIGWSRTGEPGAKWHGDFRDEGEFDGWSEVGGSDV